MSESLSLRRSDLRLDPKPAVITIRPEAPGNKSRRGREAPVPADLLESMADLASLHAKDRDRPMLDISRQWAGGAMKRAAAQTGMDPERAHPHAFHHTHGRNGVLRVVPIPVLRQWLGHQSLPDTQRYVELAEPTTSGWTGCRCRADGDGPGVNADGAELPEPMTVGQPGHVDAVHRGPGSG